MRWPVPLGCVLRSGPRCVGAYLASVLALCFMLVAPATGNSLPSLSVEYVLTHPGQLEPQAFFIPDTMPQLLPAPGQRLTLPVREQDLWLRVGLHDLPVDGAAEGYLLLDGVQAENAAFWSQDGSLGHLAMNTVRGPVVPVSLQGSTSKYWVVHLQDLEFAHIAVSFESAATFQRRTTWLSGYVFILVGMGLLAAFTLAGSHIKRFKRRNLPMRSRSWLLWPSYLLTLSLFTVLHYVGVPGLLPANGILTLSIGTVLLALMILQIAMIWWASGKISSDRNTVRHWPVQLLLAFGLIGAAASVTLLWQRLDVFYGALLLLAVLRLMGSGVSGRDVHAMAPVAAALSLLLWATIALLQKTPLAFNADVRTVLLPTLLAIHGWAIHQSFISGRIVAQASQQRTRLLDQADNSFVLLRKLNHDLRSPIHGVLGMTSLLSETALNADQQEYVTTTHNAGIQMLNLADEMRALTRLASGQIQVRPRSIELNEFLHEVVSPFARLASQKSVEVVTDVLSTTPNHIRIDPELLSQVLRIILDNSVKFTEQGVIQVTVRQEGADRLRMRIDDTGHGVSSVDLPRLFEFQRHQKDLEAGQASMRLGLPVANALVQAMQGQIGVSRSAQQGASFWLSVPFTAEETPDEKTQATTVAPLLEQKILIVDDHLACRKVLEDQTRNWGMQPELASSGKEALALLQSHMYFHQPFDWVVIDYRMPEMNGLELVEKIRNLDGLRGLRVIVMSGVDLHYVEQTADDLEVVAVLAKPVNNRQLMRLLSEHA